MPEFTPFTLSLWILSLCGEAALAAGMLRSGSFRRWPSLFCYLLLQLARDAQLLLIAYPGPATDHAAMVYFWTFWIGQALIQVAQLWMLWQVVADIACLSAKGRHVLLNLYLMLIGVMVALSAWITRHLDAPFYLKVTHEVLQLQRCLSFAWILAVLATLATTALLGLPWGREAFTVSLGFTFSSAADAVCSALVHDPATWARFFTTSNALYVFTLAIWGTTFLRSRTRLPASIPSERLKDALCRIETAQEHLKSQ